MVEKIRNYLYEQNIVDDNLRLNVDFLGEQPTEFTIVPIAIDPIVERYINGATYRQYQFQLVSQNSYGADVLQNMANSNFYNELYDKINTLNKNKVLPDIDGIDKIECLDNGAIEVATTNTARYSIIMRVLYNKEA